MSRTLNLSRCEHLRNLEGLDHWNTSNVNTLLRCFSGCTDLKSLDLSSWDTSKVVNMSGCFAGCTSLIYLNIENWIIKNRCSINHIFDRCNNLSIIKCRPDTFEKLLNNEWRYENGIALRL